MNFQDCLEKGLIKKAEFSKEIIQKEIDIADTFFEKSKKFIDDNEFEASAMFCYMTMFHYCRALLYSNNYKERSHYCIFQYIVDNYKGTIRDLAENCQKYRYIRETIQYDGSGADEELVTEMIIDTKKLETEIKKMLNL